MTREEAINTVRNIYQTDKEKEALEILIPEFAESKDEGIRKEIYNFFKNFKETGRWKSILDVNTWLAYLEKQQERNVVPSRETILGICWKEDLEEREGLTQLQYIQKYWPGGTINGEPIPTENQSVNIPLAELSEEDESELQNAIDALEFLGKKGVYKSESGYDAALQAASWLKSLPERLNLQPKEEWSDEDEKMLTELLLTIEPSNNYDEMRNWLLLKLKALLLQGSKDSLQTSWKPSEEQMEALEYVIRDYREDCCNATANYLQEVLDHLKNM